MTREEKRKWKERAHIICDNYARRIIGFDEQHDDFIIDLQCSKLSDEDKEYVRKRLYGDEFVRAKVKREGRLYNKNAERPMLKYHVEVRP